MPLNVSAIHAHPFADVEQSLSDRDCMLFALSVGLGRDPMDESELPYVFEDGLKCFPTLPIVMGHPGPWMAQPALGINRQMLVHGTQRLELQGTLSPGRSYIASNRVLELVDKGEESGAIIVLERTLKDAQTGQAVARIESGTFCRADGGFGGQRQLSRDFRAVPERAPDALQDMPTEHNQALWYRLNGDRNPLHASPAFAARAGFERPILHGLCTYSVAAHGLMKLHPGRALRMLETRFSKPVYPGETVRVEAWHENGGTAFRARVVERGATVLDRGFAEFA
ncbi:MaoC/PaaZ C-terminal domain-containing protein [Hydrogenophaga sp. BPS33]|uniref:MaoC/PaaZ C-terminal domain-containing protein n=1 Tax=Hydrogenophaga sp. BPS33 TaxID=2651974 RepID=UPI00131FA8DE|nr:MaoC/PaaZ C-terminal domain-containing protein [Hydrogenophaga sp. BPS33]QHE84596.1 3-alpha,7-alpha,12-alpha-trihydroxy-5-beta-cholest-24-enoyl-CoA hydratase [Hydrogenophaga sp. BPS33]